MTIKDKTWDKVSIESDKQSLENISAFCNKFILGIEQRGGCWDFYFNSGDKNSMLKILSQLKESYSFKFSVERIKYEDWHLSWKKNFIPIHYNEDIVVIPDWDKNIYSKKHVVKIKPGMSFGTGHHETTHLMICALINLNLTGKSVLDLGFGSGILSIIAKKLGAKEVLAIELDENCKEDIEFNLDLNDISGEVEVSMQDARLLETYGYDVILANIEKNIIMDLIPLIKVKDSKVILSGILLSQKEDVLARLTKQNFKNICSYKKNEWICITAEY